MRSSKPGPGPADRGGDGLGVVAGDGGRRGAALGEAVAGDDGRRTAARASMRRISSTGMSAAPVTATRRRRQVVAGPVGVVEDRLVERRRPGQHGDPLGRHPGQHPVDVEHRLGEHRGPGGDRGQDAGLQPEHVEVRVHHQVAVAGGAGRSSPPSRWRPAASGRGSAPRPWRAGGARGEEDVGDVVGGRPRRPGGRPRPGRRRSARATRSSHDDRPVGAGPGDDDGRGEVGQVDAGAGEHRRRSRCRGSR